VPFSACSGRWKSGREVLFLLGRGTCLPHCHSLGWEVGGGHGHRLHPFLPLPRRGIASPAWATAISGVAFLPGFTCRRHLICTCLGARGRTCLPCLPAGHLGLPGSDLNLHYRRPGCNQATCLPAWVPRWLVLPPGTILGGGWVHCLPAGLWVGCYRALPPPTACLLPWDTTDGCLH